MKKILHSMKTNWILFVIILQPILDIVAFFTFNTNITIISFTARTLILCFIVLYSFIKSKDKKRFILKLSPIFIFSALHIINGFRVGYLSLFSDLRYLISVMQLPIITICLIDYLKDRKEKLHQIKIGFVINVLIIFLSILISFFTKSYNNTYEGYGITGWFSSANTQSMILTAICPLFMYYINKNKGIKAYILSHLILFVLLFFNGTKACLITLIITVIFMLYSSFYIKDKKIRQYKFLITLFFIVIIIFNFQLSGTYTRGKILSENEIENKEIAKVELNKELIDIDFKNLKKNEAIKLLNTSYYYRGLIDLYGEDKVYEFMKDKLSYSALSDNRLRKKTYAHIIWNDSDFITKLVGFEFTKIDKYHMDLENDFTALFYYYGYIGFALYVMFISYFIYILFKKLLKDKSVIHNLEFLVICLTFLLILFGSEYSGAFLRKANANIYLCFIFIIIYFSYSIKVDSIPNNKRKIKFLLLHLGYGGIETSTINTANALSKKYDIELISLYNLKNNQVNNINKKVKVKFLYNGEPNKKEFKEALNNRNILKILKEGTKSLKIILLKKILIIKEILNDDGNILISTRIEFSELLSKYGNDKQLKIIQEHQHHNNNKKYIKRLINSCYNVDYLFALTKTLENDYKKFLVNNFKIKIVCVPNMLISNNKDISDLKNKNIISVGRLHYKKRIDDLIEIFSKIKTKNTNLYIIGDGEEYSNLENQIKELKLENRVYLLGYKNQDEIKEYMLKSCIFAMTSETEGLPMVLLEAMNYGIPCIAFETDSGVKDIISNDNNGYVIKNRNKKKYIACLEKMLKDKKKLKELSTNAIKTSHKFKEEEITKIWISILNMH